MCKKILSLKYNKFLSDSYKIDSNKTIKVLKPKF